MSINTINHTSENILPLTDLNGKSFTELEISQYTKNVKMSNHLLDFFLNQILNKFGNDFVSDDFLILSFEYMKELEKKLNGNKFDESVNNL